MQNLVVVTSDGLMVFLVHVNFKWTPLDQIHSNRKKFDIEFLDMPDPTLPINRRLFEDITDFNALPSVRFIHLLKRFLHRLQRSRNLYASNNLLV